MPNGYDSHSDSLREAAATRRKDGAAAQTRNGANRYDTSTPERRRKARAAANRSDNPADHVESASSGDLATHDNRFTARGGLRPSRMGMEECGTDFADGYVLGKAAASQDHGDWGGDGGDWEGHMHEAKKKSLPPWLKDKEGKGGDSDSKGGDDGDKNLPPWLQKGKGKGKRGKQAESALNPQIYPRESLEPFSEAPLNAKKRNALPKGDFAGPDRSYPIDTPARARSALARVEANGTPAEISRVRAAVRRKYPDMQVQGGKKS